MSTSVGRRLSATLIDPYVPIADLERRQNVRVLAGITLAIVPLIVVGLTLTALLMPGSREMLEATLPYAALLLGATVATYFMVRLGYDRIAAAGVIGVLNVVILVSAAPNGFPRADSIFIYFLVPILLTCAFISTTVGFFVLIAIILTTILYTELVVAPVISPEPYYNSIIKLFIIGLVMIGVLIHVKRLVTLNRNRLRHSEMILRLIKENVSDMVTITDRAFNVDFQSDSARQLAGVQNAGSTELDAAFWQTSIEPEDQPDVAKAVDSALHSRTASRAEYRHKAADGTIHWYETTFNVVRDVDGYERLITISRNIDERKAAELALARERVQLRTVVDTLPDLIYIKDIDGKYLLFNKAYLAFLDLPSEEAIIGKTAYDLFTPEMARAFSEQDEVVFKTGQTKIDLNFRYEHKGEERYFLITKNPMFDIAGNVIGIIGCSRDISQQVKFEDEQRERERLQMALDKERELNELKNLFMVTVSHEFRTPLATILSSSELLLSYASRMSEERRVECLRTIAGEVKRLNIMLDDIRTVMHMQRREAQLKIEAIPLPDFFEGIFAKLEYAADHAVEIDIVPEIALIHGDRLLLRHIANNVLNNAARYSPPNTLIKVQGRQISETEFTVEISDQGNGIPEDEQTRVFDPFFRGGASLQTSGTGLGLTIVKHCVDLYGGSIQIESAPEKGTRMTITLPLYSAVETPAIDYAGAQSSAG